MRRPKLVAADLDGTLLLDWHSMSPEALPLIERLLGEGIAFMASSGRQYANLRRLFAPVADRISYVAEGGALAFVGSELVCERALPHDVASEAIDRVASDLLAVSCAFAHARHHPCPTFAQRSIG